MPFALILAYFIIEALGFYLVSTWIGVGWAFLALFAFMALGGLLGMSQLRATSVRAAASQGQANPARVLGDLGLIMVGTLMAASPGFVSGVLGLFFLLPPTRAFIRGFTAGRLTKSMEKFGTRVYAKSPMSQNHTTYGHFVIDEDPRE